MKNKAFVARFAAMAVLIGSLSMLVTCEVENPRALFVYDVMAVTPRQDCMIQPGQRAQAVLSMGVMDVMVTNSYMMYPRFKNMMLKSLGLIGESTTSLNTEVNYLSIVGARTWLDLGEANADLPADLYQKWVVDGVQHTVSAGLEPEQEGAVGVEVIKAEVGNILGAKMNAIKDQKVGLDINVYVMLQAQNQAGEVIYSNELPFPIKVCYNCLVAVSTSEEVTDMPCYPGQDYPFPWVMCSAIANYPEDCPNYW